MSRQKNVLSNMLHHMVLNAHDTRCCTAIHPTYYWHCAHPSRCASNNNSHTGTYTSRHTPGARLDWCCAAHLSHRVAYFRSTIAS